MRFITRKRYNECPYLFLLFSTDIRCILVYGIRLLNFPLQKKQRELHRQPASERSTFHTIPSSNKTNNKNLSLTNPASRSLAKTQRYPADEKDYDASTYVSVTRSRTVLSVNDTNKSDCDVREFRAGEFRRSVCCCEESAGRRGARGRGGSGRVSSKAKRRRGYIGR